MFRLLLFVTLFTGCITPPPDPAPRRDTGSASRPDPRDVGPDAARQADDDAALLDVGTADVRRRHDADDGSDAGRTQGRWSQIAAGDAFACALSRDRELYCWGDNATNAVSLTNDEAVVLPGIVFDEIRFDHIEAGGRHMCGAAAGSAYCWGANESGQVNPFAVGDTVAATPLADQEVLRVAAGDTHTCAIGGTPAGTWCWGSNLTLESRASDVSDVATPSEVLPGPARISVGFQSTCARSTSTGLVVCWGANDLGQSDPDSVQSAAPPNDIDEFDSESVAVGEGFACAVRRGGTVACWGTNADGRTSLGADSPSEPMDTAVTGAREIAAGRAHACAALDEGVVCWGNWHAGGTTGIETVPGTEGRRFEALAAGDAFTCGVSNGDVFCWGANDRGQSGQFAGEQPATDNFTEARRVAISD